MFLALTLLGYVALAATTILDKYLVERRLAPLVLMIFSTAIVMPVFGLLGWAAHFLSSVGDYGIALVAGAAFAGGLYAMFSGYAVTEISHSAPLVGLSTTLSVIVLSAVLSPEMFSPRVWIGIVLLVCSSFAIAFERRKTGVVLSKNMLYLVAAGILFGISHVATKILYENYGFLTGLVWSRGMMALVGCLCMCFSSVRQCVKSAFTTGSHSVAAARPGIVVLNRLLGVSGVVALQAASSLGSIVIVNALQSLQYALVIVFVWCSSRWLPRLAKEFYTRSEIVQESVVVVLLILGFVLIVP